MRQFRSWMFVPGNHQKMIDKALTLAADALILDIEDGVAPAEKDLARSQIAASLARMHLAPSKIPPCYVRVNAVGHERCHADLAAVIQPGLAGLVLPKVEMPDQVKAVSEILDRRESELNLEKDGIHLVLSVESPMGLLNAFALASASPRVRALAFGAEDFGKELGLPVRRIAEARDLLYARSAMVIAGAAAHVQVIDGVWPDIEDKAGLESYAAQGRRLGFTGMLLIHPKQIPIVNAVFGPTPEEIEYATQMIQAFEQAQGRGEGAVAVIGQMLDLPIVERARRILETAAALSDYRE